MSDKSKQNPSAEKLNRPNLAPLSGNDVDPSRAHILSGPQKSSTFNDPAPAHKITKSRKGQ